MWYSSQQVFDNMDVYIEEYFKSHDMVDLNNQLAIFLQESKEKIHQLSTENIPLKEKFREVYSMLSTSMTFIWIAHSIESYYNKKIAIEVPKYIHGDINKFVGDASFPTKKNLHMILDDMILR